MVLLIGKILIVGLCVSFSLGFEINRRYFSRFLNRMNHRPKQINPSDVEPPDELEINGKTYKPVLSHRPPPWMFRGKRSIEGAEILRCSKKNWLVREGDLWKCAEQKWKAESDPNSCINASPDNEVLCSCPKNQVPATANMVETCVNEMKLKLFGRCAFRPCPQSYKCFELKSQKRYDCVKGQTSVPFWYS